MAGIESRAKSRSVVPRATITKNIGVISRVPFSRTHRRRPSHLSVVRRCLRANCTTALSASSSCSVSRARLMAVYTRNAPKR
ncbi:Uncharacterised protein [Mycobacteroides abscessus subsp. abscessus]|nr:Uncharacterised protein [Mycobacteroides abscessus subsp. abscessus]SKW72939.1 Uncharacterised protein [Mycobacteroides abscessus subsp. abscessus]SKW75586.1 Uncharacterised protein [Mycobacteroides abscessus subsp. abscessus]